jgi:hypothetical protein
VVGRSCRTRGPSGGITAAAARGGAPPAPAFESLNGRADALYVVNEALVVRTGIALTPGRSLHDCQRCMVLGRSLKRAACSLWTNFPDLFGRAADYVDKILRGRSLGTFLSSGRPNSTWRQGAGVTIPESFLLRANEMIG